MGSSTPLNNTQEIKNMNALFNASYMTNKPNGASGNSQGKQTLKAPKSNVKTISISIGNSQIPKPQTAVTAQKKYISATPKSKISMSTTIKNKTINKTQMKQVIQ
mmetsp:Transcript_32319/g.31618  ORF Transcript_32319/g.31618 Transcript_32319/m.31618 type:complete len:105 (-) Transcript_32319:476-790(-)